MTKREAIAQLKADDIKLLTEAAELGLSDFSTKDQKLIKRAVKVLRSVRAAK